MTAVAAPNRYFTAWPDCSSPTIELDGATWHTGLPPDLRYPLAILKRLEEIGGPRGCRFYFTKDPLHLPEYGPAVIAVLLLEERTKVPAYARHVRAILRNLRSRPYLGFGLHAHMGKLEAVESFEYVRDWFTHARSHWHVRTRTPKAPPANRAASIFTLPLGYQSQQEVPQRTMAERTLDTFFAGDIATPFNRSNYRHWIPPSKTLARRQLWNVLTQLRATGKYRIELDDVRPDQHRGSDYASYSARLMNSRICVAPRGSIAETYRFYEGLRAGCLVVANRLPPEPFLKGAPVIVVDHWRELPSILARYARDLDALERYRTMSLEWWQEHCSEAVIAESLLHFLAT